MAAFDRVNNVLAVAEVVGAGTCSRGTDFPWEFLSNGAQTSIRNVQVLYRMLVWSGLSTRPAISGYSRVVS